MGLGFIVFALFGFNSTTPFPGLWALIPCLGAGLILIANTKSSPLSIVLSHPVMVFVGLISYPLYLWHWPLLSFARILEGQPISDIYKLVLLGLSVLLAWLTFQIIEKPIRTRLPILYPKNRR
jgi:peptidoglycan/LPS O-acetylase OafA/YrhL